MTDTKQSDAKKRRHAMGLVFAVDFSQQVLC